MTKKKVAVLLAVYNGIEWIEAQINSILKQENISLHLFISVDQSSDNSQQWCQSLAEKNDHISLLPSEKRYGSAAANFFRLIRAVDFSYFDYIALADQDDIWNHDKLSHAIAKMKAHHYDGYSSNVIAFWPDGRQKIIKKDYPQVEWDYLFESPGPGCTFVLTHTLANELKQFILQNTAKINKVWVHDWFIYAYARAHNYHWFIDSKPSLRYRQHNHNEIGANTGYSALIQRIKFIASGKAMTQAILLTRLLKLEKNNFVKKWYQHNRIGMLYLMTKANKCRRKPSHRLFFTFSCFLLLIIGKHK